MASPAPTNPEEKKGCNPIPFAVLLALLLVGIPAWLVNRDQTPTPIQAPATTLPPVPQTAPDAQAPASSNATTTQATSDGNDINLLLGNPSSAVTDANNRLVRRPQFDLAYNKSQGGPNWVSWHLDKSDIGRVGRGDFWPDSLLPPDSQIRPTDYRGSGYDRGHQCPSGDRTSSRANNDATFVMSNMLPQAPALNREVWARLENYCRDQVRAGNELYIMAGGSGTQGRIGQGKINVPSACWKVILVLPQGDDDLSRITPQTRVIAVSMPNQDTPEVGGARWAQYLTTPAAIEAATGYKFFSNLPDATRQALEQKKDSGRAARSSGSSSSDEQENVPDIAPLPTANSEPVALPTSTPQGASGYTFVPTEPSASSPSSGASRQVWVNTKSGVYHYPGTRWYGATKEGEYMSEAYAEAQGYHVAANGQ